jgi:hypothetical protein
MLKGLFVLISPLSSCHTLTKVPINLLALPAEIPYEPVAHACNPRYSGGRDREDCGLKPAQANSSVRPYHENTLHKKGLVEWLKV